MNSVKHNLASLAGAVALVCAAPAFALDISTYNEADANQVTLYISGATAHDPGLEKLWQLNVANGGVCADGTLDFYIAADGLKRLAYCTGSTNLPAALQGRRLAIHKASQGGSGNGVAPLVRNLGAASPDFWAVPTAGGFLTGCAGTATAATNASFSAYTRHAACANTPTADTIPQAGISDLEPAIFRTAFTPSLTTAELGAIPGNSISAVMFGIPVTKVLRDNLQRIQFGAGNACVGTETPDCQPSLTRSQLAALYTQSYGDWTAIVSPTNGAANAADANGDGILELTSNGEVFICRRVGTSGTQAVFETQLLAQRCVNGVTPFGTQAGDAVHVSEGSGSGNVVSCMTAANTAGRGAIGVLSMEFVPNTSGGAADSGFRFIKIDGQPPCLLDTVKSEYDFVGESTMQWRTAAIAGLPVLAGNPLTLAQQIRNRMGAPAVVNDLNSTFTHPICANGGSGAIIGNANTNAAQAPVPPFVVGGGGTGDVVARPILTKTRFGNSCAKMIDILPTQSTVE